MPSLLWLVWTWPNRLNLFSRLAVRAHFAASPSGGSPQWHWPTMERRRNDENAWAKLVFPPSRWQYGQGAPGECSNALTDSLTLWSETGKGKKRTKKKGNYIALKKTTQERKTGLKQKSEQRKNLLKHGEKRFEASESSGVETREKKYMKKGLFKRKEERFSKRKKRRKGLETIGRSISRTKNK